MGPISKESCDLCKVELHADNAEEELIGETANLRLSALNDDTTDLAPARTDVKSKTVLEPFNSNIATSKVPIQIKNKASKRPRKTDDTLVDVEGEEGL